MNILGQLEKIVRNNGMSMIKFIEYKNKFLELTIQPPIQISRKEKVLKIHVGGYASLINNNQRISIEEVLINSEQKEINRYLEKHFLEKNKNLSKVETTFSNQGISYGRVA